MPNTDVTTFNREQYAAKLRANLEQEISRAQLSGEGATQARVDFERELPRMIDLAQSQHDNRESEEARRRDAFTRHYTQLVADGVEPATAGITARKLVFNNF